MHIHDTKHHKKHLDKVVPVDVYVIHDILLVFVSGIKKSIFPSHYNPLGEWASYRKPQEYSEKRNASLEKAKLPDNIKGGNNDSIAKYLFLKTSHDGSVSITVALTPIRIVCKNTLNATMNNKTNTVRLLDTSNARQHQAVKKPLKFIQYSEGYQRKNSNMRFSRG